MKLNISTLTEKVIYFLLLSFEKIPQKFFVGHHTLNAQSVSGPDLRFYSFCSKFPGSVNDSRVLRNSGLFRKFENGHRPFPGALLIGDAIYPQLDYLVPMRNFTFYEYGI